MTAQGPGSSIRTDGSDQFGRSDYDTLTAPQPFPCVSLFLPTHRAGPDVAQDPIRFRNLLAAARDELAALGVAAREIDELLSSGHRLADDAGFWRHQADGLAVFLSPETFHTYRTGVVLDELAVVSARFHLRPLIPLLGGDETFWVLALSQNDVKLYRRSRHTVTEVDTGDAPTNRADALANEDPERQLQVLSSGPAGAAEYHGHGGGGEEDKDALERYFRAVDRGLADILGTAPVPLVIAGVAYYGPIYRAVSNYPHIVEEVVAGSPDEQSAVELHERAWPLIEPRGADQRTAAIDRYARERAAGRSVSGIDAVADAATQGRVDLLLVGNEHRWASTPEARESDAHIDRRPGDIDLVDTIAQRVLDTGGDLVFVSDDGMPDGDALAAVLRYA